MDYEEFDDSMIVGIPSGNAPAGKGAPVSVPRFARPQPQVSRGLVLRMIQAGSVSSRPKSPGSLNIGGGHINRRREGD